MTQQPPRPVSDDLLRYLAALGRGQQRWLALWELGPPTERQDHPHQQRHQHNLTFIRQWQQQLSYLSLQISRIEEHLHVLIDLPLEQRPWVESTLNRRTSDAFIRWRNVIDVWWRDIFINPYTFD